MDKKQINLLDIESFSVYVFHFERTLKSFYKIHTSNIRPCHLFYTHMLATNLTDVNPNSNKEYFINSVSYKSNDKNRSDISTKLSEANSHSFFIQFIFYSILINKPHTDFFRLKLKKSQFRSIS